MSETILRPDTTPAPTQVPTETLASRLKNLAFKAYVEENWPAELAGIDPMEVCEEYNEDQGSCLDRNDGHILCRVCAAYDRMANEFDGIPVG